MRQHVCIIDVLYESTSRSVIGPGGQVESAEWPRPFIGLCLHPRPAQLPETVVQLSITARCGEELLLSATRQGIADCLKAGGEDMGLLASRRRERRTEGDGQRPARE